MADQQQDPQVAAKAAQVAALAKEQANAQASIAAGQSLRSDAAYVRSQLEPLARSLTARRARNAALKDSLAKLQKGRP